MSSYLWVDMDGKCLEDSNAISYASRIRTKNESVFTDVKHIGTQIVS